MAGSHRQQGQWRDDVPLGRSQAQQHLVALLMLLAQGQEWLVDELKPGPIQCAADQAVQRPVVLALDTVRQWLVDQHPVASVLARLVAGRLSARDQVQCIARRGQEASDSDA